ncbi:hypothetical protein [Kordia sp.]|uniref:hypothetical protein n=1 Tax=Kordia sp. TaxID=1965332 RepID=UPI003B5B827A
MKKVIIAVFTVFLLSCQSDTVDSFDDKEIENSLEQRDGSTPKMDIFSMCDFEISAIGCSGKDPQMKICLGDSFCFTTSELSTSISGNTAIPGLEEFRNSLYNRMCFKVTIENQSRCGNVIEILSYNKSEDVFYIQQFNINAFEPFEFYYCVPNCEVLFP